MLEGVLILIVANYMIHWKILWLASVYQRSGSKITLHLILNKILFRRQF